MGYAVIQIGYTCYGIGDTADDAIENAQEWLDEKTTNIPEYSKSLNDGDLCVIECTDEYANAVNGGNADAGYQITGTYSFVCDLAY
jgi:hypothetical protein